MFFLNIYDLDSIKESRLNSFLHKVDYTLIYSSISYLKLIQDHLCCSVRFIVVENENDEFLGVFPIALKENDSGECIINSLPFYGSYGGITVICNEDLKNEVRKLLLKGFYQIVSQNNCVAYTIICNPMDIENENWMKDSVKYNYIDKRIGQITQLPPNTPEAPACLLKMFEDPRPRNIRKAIKEKVEVCIDNSLENLNFLYSVHNQNILSINGKPKKMDFFLSIPRYFDNNEFKLYTAIHDGKKIAALLLFYFNKTVEYFTPAVIEEYRNLQPTSLIIYRAMLDAIKEGYQYWNWGGTWLTQNGVYQFKKKWAAKEYVYHYYVNVIQDKILKKTKGELAAEFPDFYVFPFNLVNEK
jgi:hypothetical protein